MKKLFLQAYSISFALVLLLGTMPKLKAESEQSIVRKIAAFHTLYGGFEANFSISEGMSGGMSGKVRYVHPGRIRVDFSNPSGKKIISNGKYLWVYDQNRNSVGRQNVYPRSLSGGLGFLVGYSNIQSSASGSGYVVRLSSRTAYWKSVVIRARKDYIPTQIIMSDGKGGSKTITFSAIKKGRSFPGKIFDFRVPGSAQTVENPLNLK